MKLVYYIAFVFITLILAGCVQVTTAPDYSMSRAGDENVRQDVRVVATVKVPL